MTDGEGTEPIGDLRKRFEDQLDQAKSATTEATAKATEAEKRAAEAERKLAFAEAGINLADKRAQMFVKGYDGELEPEKVKAAWTDLFGESEPEKGKQGQGEQESQDLSELNIMNQVTAGTELKLPEGKSADLVEGIHKIRREGGSAEDVAWFLDAHGYPVAEGYRRQ